MSDRGLSRKEALGLGAAGFAAGAAVVGGMAAALGTKPKPAELATAFTATFRRDGVPARPGDDGWDAAQAIRVPLLPQQLATPFLVQGTVPELVVRGLHDGRELGFLLEWADAELDDVDGIGRFRDAVAVQLPARAGAAPAVTMGSRGAPVHIVQWRASWERDMTHRAEAHDFFPNVVHDVMPEDVLDSRSAAAYQPGRAVGNPLSAARRTSSVEEIVAEGFGSATSLAAQQARGAGEWRDGGWRVTVALPLARSAGERLSPGTTWPVAFALWAGSAGDRGSRKHYADWVSVSLEGAPR